MTRPEGSETAAEIRARLPHPVVDGDGHLIEYLPALAGYLREEGVDPAGADHPAPAARPLRSRRRTGTRPAPRTGPASASPVRPGGAPPPRNTRDLATALFPSLLHERLDEFGIDVSVVYPSMGLAFLHLEDADERAGACRALNRYCADQFDALRRPPRPRRRHPHAHPRGGRRRPRPRRRAPSASRPCSSPATSSARSRASRPTPPRGPAGSTPTASTAPTTTTPSGPAAGT